MRFRGLVGAFLLVFLSACNDGGGNSPPASPGSKPGATQPAPGSPQQPVTPPETPAPRPVDPRDVCPFQLDQGAEFQRITAAGMNVVFNCKTIMQFMAYMGRGPEDPTLESVRENYADGIRTLSASAQALRSHGNKVDRLMFVDGTTARLDIRSRTLQLPVFKKVDSMAIVAYVTGLLGVDDEKFDGLPVGTVQGVGYLNGTEAQVRSTHTTLRKFSSTYAQYRSEFLAARDVIREVAVDEREGMDFPSFMNGKFEMAFSTQKPWAVKNTLAAARAYLALPADFRETVTIIPMLPRDELLGILQPQRLHQQAIEVLARKIGKIREKAPNLERLTLTSCHFSRRNECGYLNSSKTELQLGMWIAFDSTFYELITDSAFDEQLARIFAR